MIIPPAKLTVSQLSELATAARILERIFPGCEIRIGPRRLHLDSYRKIEPASDPDEWNVYFRYYSDWGHCGTMTFGEAITMPREWYDYQRREYMLSRT